MSYGEVLGNKSAKNIRVNLYRGYIVTVSFGYILYCGCFKLFVMCGWVCVCVCVGVCVCVCVCVGVCVCVCVGFVMCVYVWVL